MKKQDVKKGSLTSRLLLYSAMAGVVLAFEPNASAEVVLRDNYSLSNSFPVTFGLAIQSQQTQSQRVRYLRHSRMRVKASRTVNTNYQTTTDYSSTTKVPNSGGSTSYCTINPTNGGE
jgi:hypothetical protein